MSEQYEDKQERQPSGQERATGYAVLTGDRLSALLETDASSKSSRERRYKQEKIPGFPGTPVSCEWKVGLDANNMPTTAEIELRREGKIIGEMKVRMEVGPDQKQIWNIWHRFVSENERGVGVGAYALKTVESFVESLNHKKQAGAATLEFQLSQPSVIEFAGSKGYEFGGEGAAESAEIYERFKKEAAEHANDPAFTERGELPSFILAKTRTEDGKPKDTVLILRDRLNQYAAEKGEDPESYLDADMVIDPQTYEETGELASGYRSIFLSWEELAGTEDQRLPFVFRAKMRKTIGS